MLLPLLFSVLAASALADTCPQSINFPSGYRGQDFGPWHANSNQHCSFDLYMQSNLNYESVDISIANIGANDRVTISSGNGSVLLTNRRYFKETITIFNRWNFNIQTGSNTQLVMVFSFAEENAKIPAAHGTVEILTKDRAPVLYLDEFLPGTAISFAPRDAYSLVIQKAEIVSDPADLLQWSNVLVYDDTAVGSLFELIGNTGAYVSNNLKVTLQLTQRINFKGAILITTTYNVQKFHTYGTIYANAAHPTQTFAIGSSAATGLGSKAACFTVIGDRDGSSPIDVRTASADSGVISVTNGGPNRNHDVAVLPLDNLPVSMSGNMWTFYLAQGSGIVKFSTNS